MAAVAKPRMTFAEYIAFEAQHELRYEFDDGHVVAMAGGTPEHAAIIGAVYLSVGAQLAASGCRAFVENLRVRTPSRKAAYPDIVVVCGPVARDAEDENTVTNPRLIIEVLSANTEGYDRGKKFAHYRSCESLVEYVLVASQEEPRIERFARSADGVWTIGPDAGLGEQLLLASVDVTLDVDAIYEGLVIENGVIRLP